MIIIDKIRDEKLQYDFNSEAAKNQHYPLKRLTNKNFLQENRYYQKKSFRKILRKTNKNNCRSRNKTS